MRRIKYCDQLIVQLQSDATVDINNLPGTVHCTDRDPQNIVEYFECTKLFLIVKEYNTL